jgi:thymidylate synthase ThyX
MSKISAEVVADSLSPQGERLPSLLVTMPRIILAELNTHRMLSKNSASSRAIPFEKMWSSVVNNPYIPMAWQKEHKGMQGTEYWTDEMFGDNNPMLVTEVLKSLYLKHMDEALISSKLMHKVGANKQTINRLLEPFMYHTVLISGTEWENFFSLRCPQYKLGEKIYRSEIDCMVANQLNGTKFGDSDNHLPKELNQFSKVDWLKMNTGQAEIHMMATAEAIWDAMNESTPKQLQPGEWHIPFENRIDNDKIEELLRGPHRASYIRHEGDVEQAKIEISTAMTARTSYTTVGDEKEFTYEDQLKLHDRMANQVPFHASPFEHCARAMSNDEFDRYHKGKLTYLNEERDYNENDEIEEPLHSEKGWCRNYRGFIQYRHILEEQKQK